MNLLTIHGANLLWLRIRGPNFQNRKGQGTKRSARRPIKVQAKFTPNYTALLSIYRKEINDTTYSGEHRNREKRDSGSDCRTNEGICSEGRSTIHQIRIHNIALRIEVVRRGPHNNTQNLPRRM